MRAAPPGRADSGSRGRWSVLAYEGVAAKLVAAGEVPQREPSAVRWLATAPCGKKVALAPSGVDGRTWVRRVRQRRTARAASEYTPHGALIASAVGEARSSGTQNACSGATAGRRQGRAGTLEGTTRGALGCRRRDRSQESACSSSTMSSRPAAHSRAAAVTAPARVRRRAMCSRGHHRGASRSPRIGVGTRIYLPPTAKRDDHPRDARREPGRSSMTSSW